jgi:GntR family transcriptional regulator
MNHLAKKKFGLPKYIQISELLIRDIGAGRLMDGERLLPERILAKSLNTTVTTLRKSLKELVKKGMLEQIQGSGNYIRHGGSDNSVYAMFRLELLSGGGLPSAQFIEIKKMDKPKNLPKFGTSHQGTRMRRMRYLNKTIIAIEEIWLDYDSGSVSQSDVSDSLYHYYQKSLGFWITRAEDRVSIAKLPTWTPNNFTLAAGTVTGFIERFSWSEDSIPIEYSQTWFDPSNANYMQRLR